MKKQEKKATLPIEESENQITSKKTKNSISKNQNSFNALTIVLVTILFGMILAFGFLLNKKENKQNAQKAYICTVENDGTILAFHIQDNGYEPIYIKNNDLDVEYGDELEYVVKKEENIGSKKVYTIKKLNVLEKNSNYWPATKTVEAVYAFNYAILNKDIVMEEECITSGKETIEEFENAIKNHTPYYARFTDYGDGSSTIISDIFYDGNTFKIAEDSTINEDNYANKKILRYEEYKYFETYETNDILIHYLTNTPNIVKTAKEQGIFSMLNDENVSIEPLDIYWLYYDMTEYLENIKKNDVKILETNTLTFEDGNIPYPKLYITYDHYVDKNFVSKNDKNQNTEENKIYSKTQKEKEKDKDTEEPSNIVLETLTDEIEARDIHIEQDGKVFNQVGLGTLEKDLSGYLILVDETDSIQFNVEEKYDFDVVNVKVYSYSDIQKEQAEPLQEFSFNEKEYQTQTLGNGFYIYEVQIIGENYNTRYVFFLQKQ